MAPAEGEEDTDGTAECVCDEIAETAIAVGDYVELEEFDREGCECNDCDGFPAAVEEEIKTDAVGDEENDV